MAVSIAAEANPIYKDAMRIRPQHGKTVDTEALASQGNSQLAAITMVVWAIAILIHNDGCSSEDETLAHEQAGPMVRPRRAALNGIQERGQVLRVDLLQVPRQDSNRSTYAVEHSLAQRQIGFIPQVNRQQFKLCVYLCLGICWNECLKRTLSFCRPVSTREQVWSKRGDTGLDAWAKHHKRK
ncbi:hypothetical protein AOQ84DRAFT_368571 [Glonium stellatum]|uniref:Uncharacterized protein n=1 Tax=Glonium stellatum TaxID=574774 RepID=A0A8E2EQX8_9PEZI|nr:hypothetical protein AOQ84DRAFT_368571 [Glonium stellatum]